ncbi:MAG: NAD kinase [Micavibrio sp.]|nr:NAD kinase [Micavibrio sp.]
MKLAFYAGRKPRAQKALEELKSTYGAVDPEEAAAIVVLGGDGTMLRALHEFEDYAAPLFGMNLGTLGFLLNHHNKDGLVERIRKAKRFSIHPLQMKATDQDNKTHELVAFNEVSLLRETHNSAKIQISVNGVMRIKELVCDGVMVSTPVGSTAYNSSAGGHILPLNSNVLSVTPISPFRPRRWPGALLHNQSKITFDILKSVERPVSVSADSKEVRNIVKVDITEARKITKTLLYDPDNPLEERIFKEQFFG